MLATERGCVVGVSPSSHLVAVGFEGKLSYTCVPQLPDA